MTMSPEERIVRLEEAAAFADRASEELSGEVARAFEMIARLEARLRALEEGLRKAGEDAPESDEPDGPGTG
jgi:uncharacterized coiled-coil protein SlyX